MFWDASAVVPLLVPELASVKVASALRENGEAVVWWGTSVEVLSALHRRRRDGSLDDAGFRRARRRLASFLEDVDVVAPSESVRQRAEDLVASHPIRAADALQLAAALTWAPEPRSTGGFVSLDERLRTAARQEGFSLRPV
jgi:hypothetical protein